MKTEVNRLCEELGEHVSQRSDRYECITSGRGLSDTERREESLCV